ncbi:hypothetical protein OF829_16180 [Sphingomonas sp. LB-2]|uniref:hypothetical protein n=1 Tax=Sphingomonas caeni TaxID=2984949 RepID=UPI00222EBCBC|nr:hypothetical protein [Sphingomonas caeni]MCW3848776.1 hypothetical protein [Sphingomonas caeni]
MLRWVIALLLVTFAGALPAASPPAPKGVTVTVTRGEGDEWIADYQFDQASPVWFFPRSGIDEKGQPWRLQVWTVETPGVRLVRAGHYDLLTADTPLKRVRIRMKLYTDQPEAEYAPVLRFSDGALAFFSDQFYVVPTKSIAAARALPVDLNGVGTDGTPVTLVLSDPGHRLLLRGKPITTGHVSFALDTGNTYLYTGNAPVIDTPAFAGVLDTGLPDWVKAELRDFTPRLMALYRDKLGIPAIGKPMALIAWGGDKPEGISLGGGVVDGMVVMQIRGARALTRSPETTSWMRWFIGHESAHFWMGQTLHYERISEGWITEGAADFLATRALQRLVPEYDPKTDLRDAMHDCLRFVGPMEALSRSEDRGEPRANYGCGAMLLLAAEAATRKHDPKADSFTFLRGLIDANRIDTYVNTREWLERFKLATGDAALTAEVRAFITTGVPDPKAFWRHLFAVTGVDQPVEMKSIKEMMQAG